MLKSWGQTDIGLVRASNEDAYWLGGGEDWYLALVADGMGGHRAGEVASRMAAEIVGRLMQEATREERTGVPWRQLLLAAVHQANSEVYDLARRDPALAGMGTTLTALLAHGQEFELAHVGDSRAYRLRDGKLELLTVDHSLVQELVNQGSVAAAAARFHPQRHLLTRALGTEACLAVDIGSGELLPGDVLLLCTDGLSGPVEDEEIERLLNTTPLDTAASELVRLANSRGGKDNVTVVLLEVGEGK